MNVKPFVSIVVPIYNEGKRLEECLKALLNLDYPLERYEIIAVNNGSTDNTGEIIDSYPVIHIDEQRRGTYYAHNTGVLAARGEIIAFTGADCVPEMQWLNELLKGIEFDDIGCFVGEIAPQSFVGIVDEYVHDRRIINQKMLLNSNAPVVATGNVAYRKTVFDNVGLFDTSFKSGGDSEFSWRMQKCSNFHIRYNPNALVYHPHPSNLRHLLRRSHFIGIGIARLRLKHAEDFPERMKSTIHYNKVIFITALGFIKYPFHIVVNFKKGMSFKKSLLYPILDKFCSLTHELGILDGLKQGRTSKKPHKNSHKQNGLVNIYSYQESRGVAGKYFNQIFLDLDNTSFFLKDEHKLSKLVGAELKTISQYLFKTIPDATILLTGSFSAGEGKYTWNNRQKAIQSDYDIVVVTPSIIHTIPYFIIKKLDSLKKKVSLSADIEITLLWKTLLEQHLTTTAGKIIAGKRDLCKILEELPPPRAANAITIAYRFLAGAPLDSSVYSTLLSKALIRAAQAFLLHRYKKSPRNLWVQLSSIRFCQDRIDELFLVVGKQGVDAIQKAGDDILGKRDARWGKEDFNMAQDVLRAIHTIVFPISCWQDFLRHSSWFYYKRILGLPSFSTSAYCLSGLQLLAEAWKNVDILQGETVVKASRIARHLCFQRNKRVNEDALKTYMRLYKLFSSYIIFYPNRVRISSSNPLGNTA